MSGESGQDEASDSGDDEEDDSEDEAPTKKRKAPAPPPAAKGKGKAPVQPKKPRRSEFNVSDQPSTTPKLIPFLAEQKDPASRSSTSRRLSHCRLLRWMLGDSVLGCCACACNISPFGDNSEIERRDARLRNRTVW